MKKPPPPMTVSSVRMKTPSRWSSNYSSQRNANGTQILFRMKKRWVKIQPKGKMPLIMMPRSGFMEEVCWGIWWGIWFVWNWTPKLLFQASKVMHPKMLVVLKFQTTLQGYQSKVPKEMAADDPSSQRIRFIMKRSTKMTRSHWMLVWGMDFKM